ncbi:DUF1579 family protein [Hymenobacter ginkgonis]|nr:DUF1579 family protein [Hymenobacter ginkgonis]
MEKLAFTIRLLGVLGCLAGTLPAVAQNQKASAPSGAPTPPDKAMLVELSKLNENHKLLASLAGNWSFVGKHTFPGPAKKTVEFNGNVVKKELWGGRYLETETTGIPRKMLWSEGPVTYVDRTIEGYDNVKKKFVTTSYNNELDTGFITTEGTYDSATKTFTYDGATTSHIHYDVPVGTTIKLHDIVRIIDNNHYVFERHETVDGREIILTELTYTRTTK